MGRPGAGPLLRWLQGGACRHHRRTLCLRARAGLAGWLRAPRLTSIIDATQWLTNQASAPSHSAASSRCRRYASWPAICGERAWPGPATAKPWAQQQDPTAGRSAGRHSLEGQGRGVAECVVATSLQEGGARTRVSCGPVPGGLTGPTHSSHAAANQPPARSRRAAGHPGGPGNCRLGPSGQAPCKRGPAEVFVSLTCHCACSPAPGGLAETRLPGTRERVGVGCARRPGASCAGATTYTSGAWCVEHCGWRSGAARWSGRGVASRGSRVTRHMKLEAHGRSGRACVMRWQCRA